jgi:hypothetical protein
VSRPDGVEARVLAATIEQIAREPAHALNVVEHIAIEAFKVRLTHRWMHETREDSARTALADAQAMIQALAEARMQS